MNVETGRMEKSLEALGTTENKVFGAVGSISSDETVYCSFDTVAVSYSTFKTVTVSHCPANKLNFLEQLITARLQTKDVNICVRLNV